MKKNSKTANPLDIALKTIEKEHGKGAAMWADSDIIVDDYDVLSTGSMGLDKATGIGGLPRGRIIDVFGPESCLDKDTFISYEVWNGDKRINHKGGTIKKLYERFHKINTKQGGPAQDNTGPFYVKSVNDDDRIIRNEVIDVVATGTKECYELQLETGEKICATAEHKFMTQAGFLPLSHLTEGIEVLIHNNTRVRGRKKYEARPAVCVKYHPHFPTKIVHDKKTGNDYLYYRGQLSRAAYEAHMNCVSLNTYIDMLNNLPKETIATLKFLPEDIHVHHIDENFRNNDINNLQLIDPSTHGLVHVQDRLRNLSFVVTPSKIESIKPVGERETYDIKCSHPYNNYIANGIAVHNSGKTTLALQVIADCHRQGFLAAFIDAEHALDLNYAANIGVDRSKTLLSQPDTAEEALQITNILTASGQFGVIVVDSTAALVPKAELEGNIGDSLPGAQARLISQTMRMLKGTAKQTNTMLLFISQMRDKINVFGFGPKQNSCVTPDTNIEVIFPDNIKFMSMEKLFEQLGYDYKNIEQDSHVDISDEDIKIKSYNIDTGKVEFKRILMLLRKRDAIVYELKTKQGDVILKASGQHKVYDVHKERYVQLNKIKSADLLTPTGHMIIADCEKTNRKEPILDLHVEDNNNYFSNGILSKNTGGNALKYYSSMRIDIRRIGAIKQGEDITGNRTKVKVVKNKCAPPFKECEVNIIYGKGIDGMQEIVDMGVKKKYFVKKGAWKYFRPEKDTPEEEWITVGNSADAFNSFLEDRPEIKELILNDIPLESNEDNKPNALHSE